MKDDDNIYNIDNYEDEELYEILGINNPSDRELEENIIDNMERHAKGSQLYVFFKEMYRRFFDISDDEDEDEDEGIEGFEATPIEPTQGRVANMVKKDGTISQMAAPNLALVEEAKTAGTTATTVKDAQGAPVKGEVDIKQKTIETRNVDYVKDKLNPIKRETMFKMISIDSQFREDPRNTSATNFTMNLSSSIENVLSIKLYSVQIPYTWYMVNAGYGTNYFYIKGNSPGINNGNHDIKIEIGSGNYTATQLVDAVNTRFAQIAALPSNSDVNLGGTRMIYNPTDAKVRFEIDIKKTYTEADYYMYFPYWTSPNVIGDAKSDSIPSFLGYNSDTYYPYNIKGKLDLYLTSNENTESLYWLDDTNNYFTVVQYDGQTYIEGTSTEYKKFVISFSQTNFGVNYNRVQLFNDMRGRILSSTFLDTNLSSFVEISDMVGGELHDHFELNIKLNRKTTENKMGAKIAVIFPDETEIVGGLPIWTGSSSCFGFMKKIYELSEFISETPSLVTNYQISTGANKIKFRCTNPIYDVPENILIAEIPGSGQAGYLLNAFESAINNSLITLNNTTKTSTLVNGAFNIGSSVQNTYFAIIDDKATFQIDMSRTFDQSTYITDLSNCFLNDINGAHIFNFDSNYNFTSDSYTVTKQINQLSTYTIEPGETIVLYPKTTGGPYNNGFGNQNQTPITIALNTSDSVMTFDIVGLVAFMNGIFDNYSDLDTGSNIMVQSNISYSDAGNNKYQFVFSLRVDKVLTEESYSIEFLSTDAINPWNKIYLDANYVLIDYLQTEGHSYFQGNQTIFSNTIQIQDGRNTIVFKPYVDGVADANDLNDIVVTVPAGITYTRQELLDKINELFTTNTLTLGSNISILQSDVNEYAKIRMTINKKYYPKDYKLVFFDTASFSYCGVGTTGGRSIRTGTWESTLGWLFGYHSYTEFVLNDFLSFNADNISQQNYANNAYTSIDETEGYLYSYNATNEKISVIADAVMNTNIYNYFMIVLDDFIQNHVSDSLVTITSLENDIALPTYASRVMYQCDPITGEKVAVSASNKQRMNLTSKQLYAMNQIIETRRTRTRGTSAGPVLKDIFAIVPIKLAGLAFGATYMEFGGTLQNQDRKYFGPVRIQKLSVKLMNDKGDVVILNGANWSFTIICEIMVRNNG